MPTVLDRPCCSDIDRLARKRWRGKNTAPQPTNAPPSTKSSFLFFFGFAFSGFDIDRVFSEFRKLLIGGFLLVERRHQQFLGVFFEQPRPGAKRAVTGDLVMLDFLGGAD